MNKNKETPSLNNYEVFQYGDPVEDIDLGVLPKDMGAPENWKKIAQVCKDKDVDIICFLDKPYKDCSIVVFKNSGNYAFLQKRLQDQAIAMATSDKVYVLTASIDDHKIPVYYVWDGEDTGYLLYTWNKLYKDDIEENVVDVFESFGIMANELLSPLLDQAEIF